MKRIVLFTNNTKGGILQFGLELLRDLNDLGIETFLFLPFGSQYSIDDKNKEKMLFYDFGSNRKQQRKYELSLNNSYIKKIANEVNSFQPNTCIMIDDKFVSSRVGVILSRKNTVISVIHDPDFHPKKRKLKSQIYYALWEYNRKKLIKSAHFIIALSEVSKNRIIKRYRIQDGSKIFKMNLGAHLPNVEPEKPKEISEDCNYYLFFGRLEEYKGIDLLIDAFSKSKSDHFLIVAGEGNLTEKSLYIINQDKRIIFINRFIDDSNMIWLIKNSKLVFLPYIEASQSGVLPMAYFYGVPVVTSNVPGLSQFVIDNETGFICNDGNYTSIIDESLNPCKLVEMGLNAKKYYYANMDWNKNLLNLIEKIDILDVNKNDR